MPFRCRSATAVAASAAQPARSISGMRKRR
jgi:hypothetical protein